MNTEHKQVSQSGTIVKTECISSNITPSDERCIVIQSEHSEFMPSIEHALIFKYIDRLYHRTYEISIPNLLELLESNFERQTP